MASTSTGVIERRDIWQTFWHIVASDRFMAASLLALIVLLALSGLLPQTPQDTSAYSRWLDDVQARFGGAAGILTALGMFDVAHSVAFRALAGLLGLTLTLRLIERLQELRDTARRNPPPETLAHSIDSEHPAGALAQRLVRYRVHMQGDAYTADRYPWANWAAVAAHGGALLMLAGLLLSTLTDWRADSLSLSAEAATPIRGTPYTLLASDMGTQGEVDLLLLQNGQVLVQGHIAPGQPLTARGIQFYVQELQPALRVSAEGPDSAPVSVQTRADSVVTGTLLLIFDPTRPDPSFAAPSAQLFAQVTAEDAESYRVSVISISDGKLITQAAIRAGEDLRVEGYRFTFNSASHALISLVYAPSQWVIALGTVLAIAGLSGVALYPARRIWLTPQVTGTRIVCDDPDFDIAQQLGVTHT